MLAFGHFYLKLHFKGKYCFLSSFILFWNHPPWRWFVVLFLYVSGKMIILLSTRWTDVFVIKLFLCTCFLVKARHWLDHFRGILLCFFCFFFNKTKKSGKVNISHYTWLSTQRGHTQWAILLFSFSLSVPFPPVFLLLCHTLQSVYKALNLLSNQEQSEQWAKESSTGLLKIFLLQVILNNCLIY